MVSFFAPLLQIMVLICFFVSFFASNMVPNNTDLDEKSKLENVTDPGLDLSSSLKIESDGAARLFINDFFLLLILWGGAPPPPPPPPTTGAAPPPGWGGGGKRRKRLG